MNSQQLLFINFLIFLALVLFFWFGRSKPKQPTRLNMKAPPSQPEELLQDKKQILELKPEKEPIARDVSPKKPAQLGAVKTVYFVYNGHEWDAYEVLGLPRGCAINTATSHYQNLIKTSDPSTFEFYDAAYSAILKTKS
ncbi:hypothetical protein K2P97_06120 [bacterium]|nr:hypothetical protein [bacterium]